AATKHLLEQDAGLHRPEEDQKLQVRDVDASGQQVDGHDDPWLGAVAEFADALEWAIDPASDLGDEVFSLAEDLPRHGDELVGVRHVWQVVGGEDQRLREPAVLRLELIRVLLQLREDLPVRVRRGDLALDLGGIKGALVLEQVELPRACLGVDLVNLLALAKEDAVDANVGADLHHVVVNEVARTDRALVFVAEHQVLEVRHSVGSGSRREPDLDGVEVVERVTPDGAFLGRVAAVALVSDDQVEGMDGDVELLDVGVDLLVVNLESALAAEEVHRHALDRGDVHERVTKLRIGQQRRRHDCGVERAIVTEVLPPEGLGVDRVDLVELQT